MNRIRVVFACALAGLALAWTPQAARAGIDSSTPNALGGGREYGMSGPPAQYHFGSFFDVFADFEFSQTGPAHDPPAPGGVSPGQSPGLGGGDLRLNGLPPGTPVKGTLSCVSSFFDVFVDIAPDGTRSFDTEMLQLDLHGTSPDLPAPGTWMIRESPTRQSLGHYTVQPLPGGMYHIDSFFDVFTELSLDGGQSWIPSTDSSGAPASSRLTIMPAPGAVALMGMSGLLCLRRRRA